MYRSRRYIRRYDDMTFVKRLGSLKDGLSLEECQPVVRAIHWAKVAPLAHTAEKQKEKKNTKQKKDKNENENWKNENISPAKILDLGGRRRNLVMINRIDHARSMLSPPLC